MIFISLGEFIFDHLKRKLQNKKCYFKNDLQREKIEIQYVTAGYKFIQTFRHGQDVMQGQF